MATATENLIVTGSSGLIGRAVIRRAGPDVHEFGLDREGPPEPPPQTEHVIACDLTSDESVQEALAEVRARDGEPVASVVHLAAYYDFSGRPSPLYARVTVEGTRRLIRELRRMDVEQFVFSSTMLVHAPCRPGERINEDWPLDPRWDYPQSKLETEHVILAERGELPVVLLRIAGVYDEMCHSIPLAHQIQRIREKQFTARVFPGRIEHGQSFLHLDDLTDAILRVIARRHSLPPVTTLLLGEPETLSYDWLQRTMARLLRNEDWETHEISKAIARSGAWLQDVTPGMDPFIKPWMIDRADDHYALDVSAAERLLDWRPQRSLRATLPRMIARLQEDPGRWYRENGLKC